MTTLTINLDPTEFIDATAFKAGDVWWSDGKVIAASDLIGWTALVPIEAEEETIANAWFPDAQAPHPARRLVTPWEEA